MVNLPAFEEFNNLNESDGFDPKDASMRLKSKAADNIRRYRVAQEKVITMLLRDMNFCYNLIR